MTHYRRWRIDELPHLVGVAGENGARIAQNVDGFVSYGPCCRLAPATYFAGFHIEAIAKSEAANVLHLDVCRREATEVVAARDVHSDELFSGVAGLVGIGFTIEEETSDLEVRLQVSSAAAVAVRSLVIFRDEQR